jgi:hypothetical protein
VRAPIEIDAPGVAHTLVDVAPSRLEVDFPISEAQPAAPQPAAAAPGAPTAPRVDPVVPPAHDLRAIEPTPTLERGGPAERSLAPLWLSATLLVIGLGLGLLAGYLVWGRSAGPARAPVLAPITAAENAPGVAVPGPAAPAPSPPQHAAPVELAAPPVAKAAPVRGRVFVRSRPSGARVSVNGRSRGETPVTIDDLPLGTHELTLVRQGYQPVTRRVNLKTSRTVSVTVSLQRRPAESTSRAQADAKAQAQRPKAAPESRAEATLEVVSRPSGARVFIDGKLAGTTPLTTTSIGAGAHAVRLELAGHNPWTTSVTLERGRRTRVAGSLELVP